MVTPAQTPKLINNEWTVFIKDDAFTTLYDVFLRNFDINNKKRKEYSVLWFRQMWSALNELAGQEHALSIAVSNIENIYNSRRPPYGVIQFETKMFFSKKDGKKHRLLIVDSFNYTLPYTDIYGGTRVTLREFIQQTINRITITESQLRRIIREAIRKIIA